MPSIYFFFFLLVCATNIRSQEPAADIFPLKDSSIYYERIYQFDSLSKEAIYKKSKSWTVTKFISEKSALQVDDFQNGFIIYKTHINEQFSNGTVSGIPIIFHPEYHFVIKVYIKEGKAKIVIDNLEVLFRNAYSSEKNNILTYRRDWDSVAAKVGLGKNAKKQQENFYKNFRPNLVKVDSELKAFLHQYNVMMNKESEFDF
jgi:hypothetical protein